MNAVSTAHATPLQVLLVDDNPGDLELLRETLEDGPVPVRITAVSSGYAALQLLRRNILASDPLPPELVLLDLNMPGLSGHEVLHALQLAPGQRPQVVVLTSSDAEQDVQTSLRLGADACLTKPLRPESWRALLARCRPPAAPAPGALRRDS